MKFKLQVFPSRQDRKTNLFVCFIGEVTAGQFCFEIYWPLDADQLLSGQEEPMQDIKTLIFRKLTADILYGKKNQRWSYLINWTFINKIE